MPGGSGASRVIDGAKGDQGGDDQERHVPADDVGALDGAAAGDQQCGAVAPDVGSHGGSLAAGSEALDAPSVHHDILAGGQERDQGGGGDRGRRCCGRIGQGEQHGAQHERGLDGEPASRGGGRDGAAGRAARVWSSTGDQRNFSE